MEQLVLDLTNPQVHICSNMAAPHTLLLMSPCSSASARSLGIPSRLGGALVVYT